MSDWQDLLSEQLRELESKAGDPALTDKTLALLRVIRSYEQRVRRLALKRDYRLVKRGRIAAPQ